MELSQEPVILKNIRWMRGVAYFLAAKQEMALKDYSELVDL